MPSALSRCREAENAEAAPVRFKWRARVSAGGFIGGFADPGAMARRRRLQKQFREFTNNTRFIVTANLNSRVIKVSLTHDARQGSRIVQNANVVFDTFALFGFGLGFYGPGYRN